MVRETRYLIVRNLPENCTEETVIDHFQRYGKIQSVKLQPAKDNEAGNNTATVAFNDIKSAAKAHHAKNVLGEVTLRTDYWDNLANPSPGTPGTVRTASYTSSAATTARPVSSFLSWNKGTSEDSSVDKGDGTSGTTPSLTTSSSLDKPLERSRPREKKKKFGSKFGSEKTGSFGRHGATTSMRLMEASRSQSEAAAAAAAAAASSTPAAPASAVIGLNPIIVSDTKEAAAATKETAKPQQPAVVVSPVSTVKKAEKPTTQSRSASRSRSKSRGSRSSSSDSSGTTSSTSPHRSHGSANARPQSMVGATRLVSQEPKEKRDPEDRRPLGIQVTRLPMRSTDSSLRDGLYHEYKKHGKVTTVQIFGDGDGRCAVVSFRKPEDASKAMEASQGKTFFGAKIKVAPHEGVEVDDPDKLSDSDCMDEYHVKSTRTLFVGNLEKDTTKQDLIDKFKEYGKIIDVDIKRQGATTAFAFVQYSDILAVVKALRAMEGEHIGINKIKLGFGKSMPTCCVWVDNLPLDATNRCLKTNMSRYGEVTHCFVDRDKGKGLIYFNTYEDAQHCVTDTKMRPHFMKKKLQVDFASRECQLEFLDRMEETNQLRPGERPDDSRGHKYRGQRSFDAFQDDGSPTGYSSSYSSRSQPGYSTPHNGRSSSGNYREKGSSRSGRQYGEAGFTEEFTPGSSSRRSRKSTTDEFVQPSYYSSKTSGDDYDIVLREYERQRKDRDASPRRSTDQPSRRSSHDRSVDRRVELVSRRSSRDRSVERYDDGRLRDRPVDHFSRDGSPSSEHNSFRSDGRYRRDEKYRYEDREYGHPSRTTSPIYHNHSSLHSQGSRSRSHSPPTPTEEDSPMYKLYDDYKRSDMDYDTYSSSGKRRESDELRSKSGLPWHPPSSKLGAELAKTVSEKSRKRTYDEAGLPVSNKDARHHRKVRGSTGKSGDVRSGSPGSTGSHEDSEIGSGSIHGDELQNLRHAKKKLLKELSMMEENEMPTSDPDSPLSSAKLKSSISHDDKKSEMLGHKSSSEKRRDVRYGFNEDLGGLREDRLDIAGNSDGEYDSDFRSKVRKVDNIHSRSYNRQSSALGSDDEDIDKKLDARLMEKSCDIRTNSMKSRYFNFEGKMQNSSPSCDKDYYKHRHGDKDTTVINHQHSFKSDFRLSSSDLLGLTKSPERQFSPSFSEEHNSGSVTPGSNSPKRLSPLHWQHSTGASPSRLDLAMDNELYGDPEPSPLLLDDDLSDDSIGEPLQAPENLEKRLRDIDEIMNRTAPSKPVDSLHLSSGISNNNENSSSYTFKKFEPSKTMQELLKKKESILDQDFKRLEQNQLKLELDSSQQFDMSTLSIPSIKKEVISPNSISNTLLDSKAKSWLNRTSVVTSIPGVLPISSSSSVSPVTTSSSMLQPTVTSSLAGSLTTPTTSSALGGPLVTSVQSAQRAEITPLVNPKPQDPASTPDHSGSNTSPLTVKVEVSSNAVASVLSPSSSSVLSMSAQSTSSVQSSDVLAESESKAESDVTSSPLPQSSLAQNMTVSSTPCNSSSSISTNVSSPLKPISSQHQHSEHQKSPSHPSSSSLLLLSSESSSLVNQPANGSPATTPFTHAPNKSQLQMPTVGQEAPSVLSPSFLPENSRTEVSSLSEKSEKESSDKTNNENSELQSTHQDQPCNDSVKKEVVTEKVKLELPELPQSSVSQVEESPSSTEPKSSSNLNLEKYSSKDSIKSEVKAQTVATASCMDTSNDNHSVVKTDTLLEKSMDSTQTCQSEVIEAISKNENPSLSKSTKDTCEVTDNKMEVGSEVDDIKTESKASDLSTPSAVSASSTPSKPTTSASVSSSSSKGDKKSSTKSNTHSKSSANKAPVVPLFTPDPKEKSSHHSSKDSDKHKSRSSSSSVDRKSPKPGSGRENHEKGEKKGADKHKEAEKQKHKDKNNQSKDIDKSKDKKDESIKKKLDKKDEKKNVVKDDKKDKNYIIKKEKVNEKDKEKSKDSKLSSEKNIKNESESLKKDKKSKEKSKESSSSKDKSGDKKSLSGSLSCLTKHSPDEAATKSIKSEHRGSSDVKDSKKSSSAKEIDKEGNTDHRHKGESKSMKTSDASSSSKKSKDSEKDKHSKDKQKKSKEEERQKDKLKLKEKEDKDGEENDEKESKIKEDERLKREKEEDEKIKREKEERDRKEKEEKEKKEKERLDKERKQKEKDEKERKEKEEKDRLKKEREEREKQKQKEREEREAKKEKERLLKEKEKERLEKERKEREEKEKQKEKERKEKEKKEKERKEKERKEKERKEKERREKEKEEKEIKERERREKEKEERERKEKEKKEKEKEEREKREKEKEEKERKEKEKKEKERKEKEEREKKEKERKEKEREKKEKEERIKREKEEKARIEKEERLKKEKEEKAKKAKKEKEKAEKEKEKINKEKERQKEKEKSKEKEEKAKEKDEKSKEKDEPETKKKPPVKKAKRNELAALLDSNDMFQMSFTSMYDRVKTQRNSGRDETPSKSPSHSNKSFERNKKGALKSSLYSFDSNSESSEDNDSDSDSESPSKAKPSKASSKSPKQSTVKEAKTPKSKSKQKRAHLSSSSSSGDDDDAALLTVSSKPKNKPTGKFNNIFSSDSEDETPISKKSKSDKKKSKPAAKRRKIREDSSDSMASRDGFIKPQTKSAATDLSDDSLSDLSEDEEEIPKPTKAKKRKLSKSGDSEKRDSSIESVRKSGKVERDSSVESVSKKSIKPEAKKKGSKKKDSDEKDEVPEKKKKLESEKVDTKKDIKSKDKMKAKVENDDTNKEKKKKKDDDGQKKKKKKKYDPKEEEDIVNSLITKMYDPEKSKQNKKQKKKKSNIFDSESEDLVSEMDVSASSSAEDKKDSKPDIVPQDKVKTKEIDSKGKSDTKQVKTPEIKKEHKKEKSKDKKEDETKLKEIVKKEKDDEERPVEKKSEKKEPVEKKSNDKKKSDPPKVSAIEDLEIKSEPVIEESPDKKKKKKKKDQEKDVEKMDKDKLAQNEKAVGKDKSDTGKSTHKMERSASSDSKNFVVETLKSPVQEDEDEFTSFWGHPKPVLIPKRFKETPKGEDDDKSKELGEKSDDSSKDEKDEDTSSKSTSKENEKKSSDAFLQKSLDISDTPKNEESNEDMIIPISEAEQTVVTESSPPVSAGTDVSPLPGLDSEDDTPALQESNDEDDLPPLHIDEFSESENKKKKEKNKNMKQQEKEKSDRVDEIIAQVAAGDSSDESSSVKPSPESLLIDSVSNDQELDLDDVINQRDTKPSTSSDKFPFSGIGKDFPQKPDVLLSPGSKKALPEKKDAKYFENLDEETRKKDEEHLKALEEILLNDKVPKKLTKEEIKKKEEEEKLKAEEERKRAEEEKRKAEEEEKVRKEKEEQAMREAREEADRAASDLEKLLGMEPDDDELDELIIEPETKAPPEVTETLLEKDKNELGVSISLDNVPEKVVTTTLDENMMIKENLDNGLELFKPFSPPQQTSTSVNMPFASSRWNPSTSVKDKTPEPMLPSSAKTVQSPPRAIMQSPQRTTMLSPGRPPHSPQRPMPSPQQQLPSQSPRLQSPTRRPSVSSPQRPLPSPQLPAYPQKSPVASMHSPQLQHSPQKSSFFPGPLPTPPGFISPTREIPPQTEQDMLTNHLNQRQRHPSFGQVHGQDHISDISQSNRRKSTELPSDIGRSPRRNAITGPDEMKSVANLDRHLPPPVSISLDNAIPEKNSPSPIRNLTIPAPQDNLLAQKKLQNFNDHTMEQAGFRSPPTNKNQLLDLIQSSKESMQQHLFPQQMKPDGLITNKLISPEQLLPRPEQLLRCNTGNVQDKILHKSPTDIIANLVKGPVSDKHVPNHPLEMPQILQTADPLSFNKSLETRNLLGKSLGQHDPMFSPPRNNHGTIEPPFPATSKTLPVVKDNLFPHKGMMHPYQENPMNFINNEPFDILNSMASPPRNTTPGFTNKPADVKLTDDSLSQDPLFKVVSDVNNRNLDRDHPPLRGGFPASFYKEPIPTKRPSIETQPKPSVPLLEDDKKGAMKIEPGRKKRKSRGENSVEDHAAQLAKKEEVEKTVQANVQSIKELTAKAAAEKACAAGPEKRKSLDAYDFEPNSMSPVPNVMDTPMFGDVRSPRGRSERGTARGRGGVGPKRGRGRGGRGGTMVNDIRDLPRDNGLRPDQGFPLLQSHQPQMPGNPPAEPSASHQQQAVYHQQPTGLLQHQPPFGQPHSLQMPPQIPHHNSGNMQPVHKLGSDNAEWPHKPMPVQSTPQPQQQPQPQTQPQPQPQHQPQPDVEPVLDTSAQLLQQQDQSSVMSLSKALASKSDVLSPEGKHFDLDSSYDEPGLVINLDDGGPPSMEGKENQYIQGSDTDDKSIPSPITGTKRTTRRTKPKPNYREMHTAGTQPVQPRTSRSGGSPRGRATEALSPKSGTSPRTRSAENSGSSPVVKLEKLDNARGTRRSQRGVREETEDESSSSTPEVMSTEGTKSKDIYKFEDTEQEQKSQPSLRPTRARKKKGSEPLEAEVPPESPSVSQHLSAETGVFGKPDVTDLPTTVAALEDEASAAPPPVVPKSGSPASNMDAIIDAVSKGNFGDMEEDSRPETPPVAEPVPTRVTRQSAVDTKRESLDKADNKAGQPQKKGGRLTVPPLRIKKEEKHYVIEQSDKEKSLAMTIKIKPPGAAGPSSTSPIATTEKLSPGNKDDKKPEVGLWTGNAVDEAKMSGPVPQQLRVEDAGVAPPPANAGPPAHLAGKLGKDPAGLPAGLQLPTPQQPSAPTAHVNPTISSSAPKQGPRAAWINKSEQESALQRQMSPHMPHAAGGPAPPSPHLPGGHTPQQLPSPGIIHQPQRPPSAHIQQPHKPPVPGDRLGKGGKHGAMDLPPQEAQKHRSGMFGFVPPAHVGQQRPPFMIPSEQPGSHPPPGHHPMHFSGPPNAKSPSLHKPDVPVRTPPVTSAGMMYGVVADQPRSLSPTSASPEGQVIERLPNPLRRGEPGPSSSPFSRLPPHHQDPSRFMKENDLSREGPPVAHGERPELVYQQQQQQLQQRQLLEHHNKLLATMYAQQDQAARSEASRNADSAHIAALRNQEATRNASSLESQRKGSLPPTSSSSHQPMNLTPSAFMPPSPGGPQRDGIPAHLYPPGLPHGMLPPGMVGRLPTIDPRLYSGQQPPAHVLAHMAQFGGSRFPMELDKGELERAQMIRSSPSPSLPRPIQQVHPMPLDMPPRDPPVGILQRFPVMWQGILALKNDQSYVQMHFIAGNRRLPNQALPQPMPNGSLNPLRIAQRMRLEHTQLDGVAKRMQCEDDYCILVAVACGRDAGDLTLQTAALYEGFIKYLNEKGAAGIVNVPLPGSEQAGFVVHIFPPCEFVNDSVETRGSSALREQLKEVPHAVIIIATT